ncbi:hypothetical protein BY996DRAFT_6429379 [Phakopsora pachyrhizi]|uniref:PWI domain-containing protein n=1 Tax=Phakopsora pachyrhizi TaxID=170000 RepID=A0AAV0BP04_PHAPC|nr:hypothetical protein BY996DRAFT_6429379 [Phakopsora pachyrhizi]CAH7688235.1 hypothetical protein PPACK8108_LOCUS23171 [Phakopsora pachyrhizi]
MYGGSYPPYPPPPGQQQPVVYGVPPPGSYPPPPGSVPFSQPGLAPPSASTPQSGFVPSAAQTPGLSPQPPHPIGLQHQAPHPQPSSQPLQHPQVGLPPPPGQVPLQHQQPPPGFQTHLHHHHLAPGPLKPSHPHPHSYPHHPHHGSYSLNNRHPGLGSHGQPHSINSVVSPPLNILNPGSVTPVPGSSPALPSRPPPTEIYSLFVGSIAEGVDDAWLERLLGCAGHLVSLRRIRDPNGKPKPFGFAEYGDPESVLRCLKVIHGLKLPVDGGRSGEKSLMIKPDDKTKARLDAYEATRIKTDQDSELDEKAVERLEGLVSQMKDPDIVAATTTDPDLDDNKPGTPNGAANSKKASAAHLQDLAPEDLPEESRGTITREIQFFRERAISKRGDAEKLSKERDRGRRDSDVGSPAGRGRAGYGSSNSTPIGPRGGANTGASSSVSSSDPQSLNRPVGFVRAGQNHRGSGSSSLAPEAGAPITDEEEERHREERRKRMNHLEFKDRERRWETRERNRAQTNQRDQQREKSLREEETRLRNQMKTRLANWDDEFEMDRGKELFYSSRSKWRSMRRTFRQREEKSDRIDEELENEQLEAIRKESEEFLNKQAEMLAKIQDENRKAGLLQLDEGGKPIELTFAGFNANNNVTNQTAGKTGIASGTTGGIQPISFKKDSKGGGGLLGNADDDDEGFKRKRALIPLTYDEDEGNQANKTTLTSKISIQFGNNHTTVKDAPPMSEEKKKKKLKDIVASIPTDKDKLWKLEVQWNLLSDAILNDKLKPFANKKIVEYLGLEEEELVNAILDHVKAKKGPNGLVEELEPVLAEEAEEFTLKFWRMLIFEIKAAEAGVSSAPAAP